MAQTFDPRIAEHWKRTSNMTVEYMWMTDPEGNNDCVLDEFGLPSYSDCGSTRILSELRDLGVEMFSPPINRLIATGPDHTVVASSLADELRDMGVAIGSWSLEREGCIFKEGDREKTPEIQPAVIGPCGEVSSNSYYYLPVEGSSAFQHVDVLMLMEALFDKVGIVALFSDFPGTVAAYLNCITTQVLV